MNFISPVFTTPTIPQPTYQSKIKLNKEEVSLQFVLSRATNQGYKVRFIVQIHPITNELGITTTLRASQIDMLSLHDAILANVLPEDKKYVTLTQFDTLKCEFTINFNTWFDNAMNNVVPRTYLSKFDQEYKLKIQPPKMILFDPMRNMFFDFMVKEFKNYLVKKNKDKKFLGPLLPKDLQKKLNIKLLNMFDYSYDYMNNRFIVQLKTMYILGTAMLVGAGIKEVKKQKFSERVEKNTSNTNWKKFTKKKFI